jgi:signal peptidase I
MKNFLSFLFETLKIVVIALVIVVPIRYFLFQPFLVKGQSMEPNFENGDYLIVDEISYKFSNPQRGEVVVFKYPHDTSQRYIKRIVGLPGETMEIKDGKIFISGKTLEEISYLPPNFFTPDFGFTKITLGEDEYFVLGDNRLHSSDSRRWGTVPREDIIGRVFVRAWPLAALAKIEIPNYSGF